MARRTRTWLAAIALAIAGGGALWWVFDPAGGATAELARGLARRGRTIVVAEGSGPPLPSLSGTQQVALSECSGLKAALRGPDATSAARALRGCGADSLLLMVRHMPAWADPRSLAGRLAEHASVPDLVGRYLSLDVALYQPDPLSEIPASHRRALAEVARRLLQGERPPRLESFPSTLRGVAHVEVMVLLSQGDRPRLWRSARGTSIARAFLTAVRVAGQRWDERSTAMGATLAEALPGLTVTISLLQDDGEFGTRSDAFIDAVVGEDHGVAYDYKGGWRYLLPRATREQGDGHPSRALRQLLADNGLTGDALSRSEVRPYRIRVRELGTSPATRAGGDPLGGVQDPDELAGAAPP